MPLSFSPLWSSALQGSSAHCHCHYKDLPASLPSAGLGCHLAFDLLLKEEEVVAQAAEDDQACVLVQKATAQEEQRLLHPAVPASDIAAGGLFLFAFASDSYSQCGGDAAALRVHRSLSVDEREKQD